MPSSTKFVSGPFEVVGNGKRMLVESEYAPPGPVARFQGLDSFGQLAEIQRKTVQNGWWYSCASISSFLGIALGVYYVELATFEHQHGAELPYFGAGFVRFCIVVLSFLSICALAVHYDGCVYVMQIKGMYIPKEASLFMRLRRAGLLDACFWDIIVQLVIPWPLFGLDVTDVSVYNGMTASYSRYSMADLLVLGMFLRLRLLPRFCALYHPLNSADARFYGKISSVDIDAWMIARTLVVENGLVLMGLWVLTVTVFSYAIYLFERDAQGELPQHETGRFASCLWLAVTIMTTTGFGFGNSHPITRPGRITAAISCLAAVVLFAITVNWIVKKFTLDAREWLREATSRLERETLVRILKQTEARRALRRAAVHVIESVYRRSPMFERFRLQKERASKEGHLYQYQDIAQLEERNIQVFGGQIEMDAKPSEVCYGTGRFTRSELLNLRESLDDRRVMEKLQALREARQQLAFFTRSQVADRHWQLSELSGTHMRLKRTVKTMGMQARQLSTLVMEHGPSTT